MSGHTPGPWAVIDGHYPAFKEVTGPSFKLSVVMLATDLTEDDYQKRDADLHLIAAAPDLLEALGQTLNAMIHLELSDSSKIEWEASKAAAYAAIAKATGGAA